MRQFAGDRPTITRIRVAGMRCLADVSLDLRGLTVLIGENGSGKSSLLEALELLRKMAQPGAFAADIVDRLHGGRGGLLRHGASTLILGADIEGEGPPMAYNVTLGFTATSSYIETESLTVWADPSASRPLDAVSRKGTEATILDVDSGSQVQFPQGALDPAALASTSMGLVAQPAQKRLVQALGGIEVHPYLDTVPSWAKAAGRDASMRHTQRVERSNRLEADGSNLPNVLNALRNGTNGAWQRVIERASHGLGHDLRDILFPQEGPPGFVTMQVHLAGLGEKTVPGWALSEGQLTYLACIAACETARERSLLCFDEPENHLHPALLTRVVWMLEELGDTTPALIGTHSDRLLDALADPASSVVVCELDEARATRLRRLDPVALADWLTDYRGLGELRENGFLPHVLQTPAAEGMAG
jgi:predicted ATPase